MSVTSFNSIESECEEADDGTIAYTSTFEAITDSASDTPRTVLSHAGAPKRGDSYSFGSSSDGYAVCVGRTVRCRDASQTRKVWRVVARYSTKGNSQNPEDNNTTPADPIDWGWKVSGDTWQRIEAPDFDRNGRAFLNTAQEPFMPPPERENVDPLLVFTKNHPTLDFTSWNESQGKVNSDVVWGMLARRVKLRRWTFEQRWLGNGAMYFANRLEVEIKFSGHYYQPANMGHRELFGINPADGKPIWRTILDETKVPVTRPVPLDDFGLQLPVGAATLFFDQAAGNRQRFEIEDEYALSGILPPTLPGNFLNF